jgi:hypothetical protein
MASTIAFSLGFFPKLPGLKLPPISRHPEIVRSIAAQMINAVFSHGSSSILIVI